MEKEEFKKRLRVKPAQTLVLGILFIILIGSILLKLPISNNKPIEYIDALFVSTTSVCVTGLTPVVIAEQFTVFGQVVIMCLIQIGGLGLMSFLVLLLVAIGKKINLSNRLILKETLNLDNFNGLVNLLIRIFKYTFIFELIGAILLATAFIPEFGAGKGIFYSVFHSISAFCNAGIDILGDNSFIDYSGNLIVNITIMLLIIIGGLGFTVWTDLADGIRNKIKNKLSYKKVFKELTLHTKLVLITTFVLLVSGTLLIFSFEYSNDTTIANDSVGQKVVESAFQSTTLRTAGFSTMPQKEMTTASKFVSICYMFVGGSPGSTAGGIKTVTLFIMLLLVITFIMDKDDVHVFKKKITTSAIKRAIVVFAVSIFIVIFAIMALLVTESIFKEDRYSADLAALYTPSFMDIIFEVVSAFGTVGLSLNLTYRLTLGGKIIIMLLMIIGRLRPSNNINSII